MSAPQQPPYQQPYQQPQKSSNTLKWVLIILGIVIALFVVGCVGCVALIGTAGNEASKEIKNHQRPGSRPGDRYDQG